jgi:epidermal growth factor receptor substrate 15
LSFDELFGSTAHKRSESQKENDFEEAFASMRQQTDEKTNGAAAAAPSSEFPPIQELHHDEEDDESSDDEGPLGFDDNFTPVSPTSSKKEKQADSIDAAQLAAFPAPGSAQPPPADAQASPPQYEASTTGDASHMPPQFNGLLPERADPTVAPDAPHSVESSTGAPVVANESQRDLGPETAAPAIAGGAKTGGPDFEAAFAGLNLAPAKEADDDDEDDEHDEGHDHKNTSDFDFSFDSPSQANHGASSSTDAGQGGSSDFFSFDNNVHAPTAQSTTSPNGGDSKAAGHDWDALFAPLAGAKPAEEETANDASSKNPGWALNNDSGEDDLILQRLTGMGFPRDDSLAALEKFDYNLDKVR